MKLNNKAKGFGAVLIVLVVLLLSAFGLLAYTYLKSSGGGSMGIDQQEVTNKQSPEISESTDIETIGKEIDQSVVNSVDQDFSELNASASSL